MDSIKAQKLQAMKNYKKAQFFYNLLVYSLTAFLSSLFYLYLFWFPSMGHFFFDFLLHIYSFFLSPKFLFILANVIVIILLVESNLAGSCSSPATQIYDEYVERSRSLRRQSIVDCKKRDGSPEMDKNEKSKITRHASLNNVRCLELKKKEMAGRSLRRPRSVVEHKKKDGRLELHENEKTAAATRDDEVDSISSLEERKKETVGQSLRRPRSLGRLDMHENEKTSDDDLNKIHLEERRKEMEQQMDELKQRVEEFIARVNRQRILEARELDSGRD